MRKTPFFLLALVLLAAPYVTRSDVVDANAALNVMAQDAELGSVSAQQAPNAAPSVTNVAPAAEAAATWMYVQEIEATDPDGDALGYALVNPPPGMAILSLVGVVYWAPTLEQAQDAPYEVTVLVSDGTHITRVTYPLKVVAPAPGHYAIVPGAGSPAATVAQAGSAPQQAIAAAPLPATGALGPIAAVEPKPETAAPLVQKSEEEAEDAGALAASTGGTLRNLTGLQRIGIGVLVALLIYLFFTYRREIALRLAGGGEPETKPKISPRGTPQQEAPLREPPFVARSGGKSPLASIDHPFLSPSQGDDELPYISR